MLGQAVAAAATRLGHDVVALSRAELDVTDADHVRRVVAAAEPRAVVNCAAWTDVDGAETAEAAATAVNGDGAGNVARAAAEVGARIVHVSTDYVFDGSSPRPYGENDETRPLSVYGASKLEGERNVLATGPEHLVVRTSGVLGRAGSAQKGGSFVDRILSQARAGKPLRVVTDQTFAPTFADELAEALLALARSAARGLLHVANAGSCSWHELAVASLRAAGIDAPVAAIKAAELKLPARRPMYSVLDTSRYLSLGLTRPRDWRDALGDLVAASRG